MLLSADSLQYDAKDGRPRSPDMTEIIVAKYLGMRVLGVACITNMAIGIAKTPHSYEEVLAIASASSQAFCRLLERVIPKYPYKPVVKLA